MSSEDFSSFHEVLEEASLPNNSLEIVEVQGRKIALIKSDGRVFAFDNTCPHLGGSLGKGTLRNNTVICPLHHWTFELATGKCLNGSPGEEVSRYEVKVEKGKILVKFP
jgi:nitrite reductase (NADH) small subunit